jgi:serine/threonine protein kinase
VATEILGGRYELEERLGFGGSSSVYRGIDRILERPVAIKILAEWHSQDVDFVSRFSREAEVAASLQHPNIIPIFDRGMDEGRSYIVMAYIAGISLEELVSREPLSPQEALEVISQAAAGLDFIHRHDLVHRDVKPANLIVDRDDQRPSELAVRVSDFGVVHLPTHNANFDGIAGTKGYLCPEAWRGEEATPQFDVYALAVVAHKLLLGGYPVRTRHGGIQVDPQISVPVGVIEALEHGLQDEPDQRTASCGEVAKEIRAALI